MTLVRLLPDWATKISAFKKLSPLEKLAWSHLTEESLLEKLVNEVWRAPVICNHSRGFKVGRPGVTLAKSMRYLNTYAGGLPKSRRTELAQVLFERARPIYHARCSKWAEDVLRASKEDPLSIECYISLVPEGARTEVRAQISRACRANIEHIYKSLKEPYQ